VDCPVLKLLNDAISTVAFDEVIMKGTSEGNRNEAVAFCFKALARRNEDKQSTTRTPTTVLPNFIRMNSEFQKAITEISSSSVGNVEFRTTCNLR